MKKMNWPNRLTLLRLILVPVVIVLVLVSYYYSGLKYNNGDHNIASGYKLAIANGDYSLPILMMAAGIIFVIASFTDFLDGYIARKYNQVTDFGKFFDPIADKLLVNATLILFAVTKMLPVWMVLVLILRDIFVDFMRMVLARKQITLAAAIWGKLKTVFEMVGLTLIFFVGFRYFPNLTNTLGDEYKYMNQVVMIPMYAATFFSIFSGVDYFIKAIKMGMFKSNAKVQ